MARPAGGYDIDGEPVPGISTVAKIGEDTGGLQHWYWHEGHAWKGTYAQWRQRTGQPVDAGTCGHALFEAWLLKQPEPDLSPYDAAAVAMARMSFGAARAWAEQSRLEVTHTELTLISRTLRVGGTLDAAARVGGQRVIADWKTSKGVYGEMKVQLGGYGLLWDEIYPDDPVTGGFHLVRFDKVTGGFEHRWWPKLEGAQHAFRLKRQLYEALKQIES
jgi:hypothetical protein